MNNFFLLFQINYFYLSFCFSGQWGLYHELSVFDQKKEKKAIPKSNCDFAIVYVFTLEIISVFASEWFSKLSNLLSWYLMLIINLILLTECALHSYLKKNGSLIKAELNRM